MTLRPSLRFNEPSVSVDSEYAGISDDDNTTEFVHDIVVITDDPPSVLNMSKNRSNQQGAHSSVLNIKTAKTR